MPPIATYGRIFELEARKVTDRKLTVVVAGSKNIPAANLSSQSSAKASMSSFVFIKYIIIAIVVVYVIFVALFSYLMIFYSKRKRKVDLSKDDFSSFDKFSDQEKLGYYRFVREEIKREDEITHQRLTWTITFHSFLINAFGVLIVFGWKDIPPDIQLFRRVAIFFVAFIGSVFSIASFIGILASRRSIDSVRDKWNIINKIWDDYYPKKVPQAFGQNNAFAWGRIYALAIPLGLISIWTLLLGGYTFVYIANVMQFIRNP